MRGDRRSSALSVVKYSFALVSSLRVKRGKSAAFGVGRVTLAAPHWLSGMRRTCFCTSSAPRRSAGPFTAERGGILPIGRAQGEGTAALPQVVPGRGGIEIVPHVAERHPELPLGRRDHEDQGFLAQVKKSPRVDGVVIGRDDPVILAGDE